MSNKPMMVGQNLGKIYFYSVVLGALITLVLFLSGCLYEPSSDAFAKLPDKKNTACWSYHVEDECDAGIPMLRVSISSGRPNYTELVSIKVSGNFAVALQVPTDSNGSGSAAICRTHDGSYQATVLTQSHLKPRTPVDDPSIWWCN